MLNAPIRAAATALCVLAVFSLHLPAIAQVEIRSTADKFAELERTAETEKGATDTPGLAILLRE